MDYKFERADELNSINELPSLFIGKDKSKIKTATDWEANRDYFLSMLKNYMYGEIPEGDFKVTGEVIFSEKIFARQAVHEFVRIEFEAKEKLSFVAEITRPAKEGQFRAITYIAFPNARNYDVEAEALKRGYIIALFNYEQLAPDENRTDAAIYKAFGDLEVKAVGLWAFCNMRLIDYLDSTGYAVKNNYITTGHSRNGKAALCAGIFDKRVKITAPNNSGCGGCGCFRFLGGKDGLTQNADKVETLRRVTTVFPHWFSVNLNQFYDTGRAADQSFNNRLPFDLHLNKALIAPRRLLSLEAYGDEWANPHGSLLTYEAAKEVFDLLGVSDNIEIKFREGGHEFGFDDWIQLLNFCDLHK